MTGTLGVTDLLTILDSMAQQAINITGGSSNATGYSNNRATILATADLKIVGDLAAAFNADPTLSVSNLFAPRLAALKRNLGALSAFLLANDKRAHEALRTILALPLAAAATMAPLMSSGTKLGHYAASGATTGVFTDGSAVDTTKYGKAWLNLRMTHDITAALQATIVGLKYDGTAQSKVVSLTGKLTGQTALVGTTGTSGDNYKDVTNVTITGGTNLDAFDIETIVERTPVL